MSEIDRVNFHGAVEDFRRARREAALQMVLAKLRGRSAELLAYNDVHEMIRAERSVSRGLQYIPLDAIVGSVNRHTDFTRTFLPRRAANEERWARVKFAMNYEGGVPPIEVYKVGEVYFVQDGNHRVSVARRNGETHINAYVTEVETKVPLSPDDEPDELICKARYASFLAETRLDELRPGADLYMTICGRYNELEERIKIHQIFLAAERGEPVPDQEAVTDWYDNVYLPVVKVIRRRGLLRDFPGRTEADLYLWLVEWQEELEEELGWELETETTAAELAARKRPRQQRLLARVGERLREVVVPRGLEAGPEPGQWRAERVAVRRRQRLFIDVLVLVEESDPHWQALTQALTIAQREEGQVHGLHMADGPNGLPSDEEEALRAAFLTRCEAVGVPGQIAMEKGRAVRKISDERARWTDLVVVKLDFPPGVQAIDRLNSPVGGLIRRSGRPILTVPERATQLRRPLLAYDGSRNAREALFVATYLADAWGAELTVVTVSESEATPGTAQGDARAYLAKYHVHANLVNQVGPVGPAIMETAAQMDSDLIIMGGYGFNPVLEVMLGSTVDHILRESNLPTLVCR